MGTQIRLHDAGALGSTVVPNLFIDEFMTAANGEYVKVYLYLLRCLGTNITNFSIGKIADCLNHTEGDVKRALCYWEKVGLLRLDYQENSITGIYLQPQKTMSERDVVESGELPVIAFGMDEQKAVKTCRENAERAQAKAEEKKAKEMDNVSPLPTKPVYSASQIAAFSAREEMVQLLYICERYLGRTLNQNDLSYVIYWNNELQFSEDLIEFLIEHAVSVKGKAKISTLRVLQNMAETWYRQGIHTPSEAKQYVKRSGASQTPLSVQVMKALGIKGRNLADSELDLVQKWSSWGFGSELITEACRRTIANTHEPSFDYTDRILYNWQKSGISSMEDVQKDDEAFQARKESAAQSRSTATAKSVSQPKAQKQYFACPSRDYDYEQLAKQMLQQR